MAPPGLRVRTVHPGELEVVLDWAASEGWNPGRADASLFWATDPEGFLMAEMDGEPAGAISAVRYGPHFGFMGLYLVPPDLRGRGIGHSLWLAALARLAGRTVGLDAVEEQEDNYAGWGFRRAYRHLRMAGAATSIALPPEEQERIVPAADVARSEIEALDASTFPAPRAGFLSRWIAPPHTALAAVTDGHVRGFGVARPCVVGHKIGPLVADDAGTARAIVGALAARTGDGPVMLDVPEANTAAVAMAEELGMVPVFECARMYMGEVPALRMGRIFGVGTLELG